MYRECRTLRDRSLFRAWVFKIAHHALLHHRQKEARRHDATDLDNLPAPGRDPLAAAHFAQWMQALESEEREIMTLRYVEGLEYHEIADVLEIPVGTAQWKIFQARKKLAARFGRAEVKR
jgi:RNA polymerase sigma-70 factor (ECF subfamily)